MRIRKGVTRLPFFMLFFKLLNQCEHELFLLPGMHWRNKILENCILPVGDLITGGRFMKELRYWRSLMAKDPAHIQQVQKQKLNKLLEYATTHSEYYRNLNVPKHEDPMTWLRSMPILSKDVIREEGLKILTVPEDKLIKVRNSGSSGIQLQTYRNAREQSVIRAVQTAFWELEGFKIGSPVIQNGINPVRTLEKRVKDFLFVTKYLPAFSISEQDAINAMEWIRSRKEDVVIVGYSSSLNILVEYLWAAGITDIPRNIRSVISLGEKLFPHYRENVKKAFGVDIYETYGASEGLMMGFQVDNQYLYIPEPHVVVEILDDEGNPVPDGEMGHVAVTSLDNFSMPMIRYTLGDLAVKLPENRYPENRKLPFKLLEKVVGRDTDVIVLPSGNKMVVQSFVGIFEHIHEIKQFCAIQTNRNGFTVEYIPSKTFREGIIEELKEEIFEKTKERFELNFVEVDHIAPTKSGKPQIVISKLKKGKPV